MNKGQIDYAERKAMENFDEWNDVTYCYPPGSSYYAETEACIHNAVHIGIHIALFGKIIYDEDGEIAKKHADEKVSFFLDEILPCPFCGSNDIKHEYYASQGRHIKCNNCDACGPSAKELEEAECDIEVSEKAWNKRVDFNNR